MEGIDDIPDGQQSKAHIIDRRQALLCIAVGVASGLGLWKILDRDSNENVALDNDTMVTQPLKEAPSTTQLSPTSTESVTSVDTTLNSDERWPSIHGRQFYNDPQREIFKHIQEQIYKGDANAAALLQVIADQPGVNWLLGNKGLDAETVSQTSSGANALGQVAVYQLYALPNRDLGAGYSGGGLDDRDQYLGWLDTLLQQLKGEALFLVEADAVAQAITSPNATTQLVEERYRTLAEAMTMLNGNQNVIGSYLDAAHPDWFPEHTILIDGLFRAGVEQGSGVAVNVSNYVGTLKVVDWTQELLHRLDPSGRMTAVIDTSRNSNGVPDNATGEERWCNVVGAGLGDNPTTEDLPSGIAAKLWVKIIGESDGECFGNARAGSFMLDSALDIVRNRRK